MNFNNPQGLENKTIEQTKTPETKEGVDLELKILEDNNKKDLENYEKIESINSLPNAGDSLSYLVDLMSKKVPSEFKKESEKYFNKYPISDIFTISKIKNSLKNSRIEENINNPHYLGKIDTESKYFFILKQIFESCYKEKFLKDNYKIESEFFDSVKGYI